MRGDICPKCGKSVMTYEHFFWRHEPFKNAECGNCGARLKRSGRIFSLLSGMFLMIAAAMLGFAWMFISETVSQILTVFAGIFVFAGGAALTNYLCYKLAGWKPA